MAKATDPGQTEYRTHPSSILIYSFDIDGDQLKPEYPAFLSPGVVPILRNGGSISFIRLASRTGSVDHDKDLSKRRAQSILAFLRREVPTEFAVRPVTGFGACKAAQEGERNETEDQRFRSVLLFVNPRPVPLTSPAPIAVSPEHLEKMAAPENPTLVVLLENGGITLPVTDIPQRLKKELPVLM